MNGRITQPRHKQAGVARLWHDQARRRRLVRRDELDAAGRDIAFTRPTAQIAAVGAQGASRPLNRRALAKASEPVAAGQQFVATNKEQPFDPYHTADVGQIDEVVKPAKTRPRLIGVLEVLRTKVETSIPKNAGLLPA